MTALTIVILVVSVLSTIGLIVTDQKTWAVGLVLLMGLQLFVARTIEARRVDVQRELRQQCFDVGKAAVNWKGQFQQCIEHVAVPAP